jgi:2-keto-4-pentenoate hydratase/2-oxohepta-3-ene-1,7-dioic acid hydratase in catechol pathway
VRIASYLLTDGTRSYGVVRNDRIFDAGPRLRAEFADLRGLLASNAVNRLEHGDGGELGLGDVTLLPTIPNPDKIICIGLNYMSHIEETGRDKPEYPSVFTRFPSSLVGHGQPIERPRASVQFDFEGELAVVVGKPGRAIAQDEAMSHVAGYACLNDGSIRDYQRHTTQFWAGKNFDRTGSMGPWLVTADELPDPAAQSLETRLNGEIMQKTRLSDLAFTIPELIAYLSIITELLPGDIIATGTPSGVGTFRNPKVFMKPGDRIEVEISGIGVLANDVVDEP